VAQPSSDRRIIGRHRRPIGWLISEFVRTGDGLLMAASDNLGRDRADHLAAVVSGITSLAQNASTTHAFHGMKLVMIESSTPRRAQLVK
jgi:predicted regulator of Ras-like GTPase activity (Roadblock/LC7/MglB family)